MSVSSDAILFYGIVYSEKGKDIINYDLDGNIKLSDHCCAGYNIPYICIIDTEKNAFRGLPIELNLDELIDLERNNSAQWDKDIKNYCEKKNFEFSKPKWYLVSWTDAF